MAHFLGLILVLASCCQLAAQGDSAAWRLDRRCHRSRRRLPPRTELLTPESTSYAEPSIGDYAERTKQTITAWNGMNGLQGGDPAKLAPSS
jgi:hypothetical protein